MDVLDNTFVRWFRFLYVRGLVPERQAHCPLIYIESVAGPKPFVVKNIYDLAQLLSTNCLYQSLVHS